MTRYRIEHETIYAYAQPVAVSQNELRLLPRQLAHQNVVDFSIAIDPIPETVIGRRDYFGNEVLFVSLDEPHERFSVTARSVVERTAEPPPQLAASPAWEDVAAAVRSGARERWLEALEYVFPSPLVPTSPELAAYALPSFPAGRPFVAGVQDLCSRIHREFAYDSKATTLATPVAEVLRHRRGVCQDFAHVAIACLRSVALPARYVSGYVRTGRDPATGTPELVGAEASHAWVSAFCPGNGWVEFDPTNDALVGDLHVTLGFGRDYDDVSPVRGVTIGGGAQRMTVRVGLTAA
jgi:transglutaminase-like putative cysteine protease